MVTMQGLDVARSLYIYTYIQMLEDGQGKVDTGIQSKERWSRGN
jgi:hypothetical protein